MTALSRRPALRWLVPLLAALVLAVGGSAAGLIAASARGGLPPRTAAQLLADVQQAKLAGFSGTVSESASLGLPALPDVGGNGGGSTSPRSLASGSHTMRVWYGGPGKARVALLTQLGESDLVRNGTDLWTWDSRTHTATHRTVPAPGSHGMHGDRSGTAPGGNLTPQQAARQALRAITPTTKVTTDGTAVVAGRSAYELVLTPRDATTLVGSVHIAIDGATHVPTRVQVYARGGSTPAFQVGFTSFDPTVPPASTFSFTPPPGAKVTEKKGLGQHGSGQHSQHPNGMGMPFAGLARPTVVGTGWSSVVVGKLPAGALGALSGSAASGSGGTSGAAGQLLNTLPKVSGTWGSGRLLQGTLFSAVLTSDGRVAVGAVAPAALYAALSR